MTNFVGDVLAGRQPGDPALVELARTGSRREWTTGEVMEASARLAGTLVANDVKRGDVVLTLAGNRSEWVFTMLAAFRLGAVVLPCNEQLRAKDLALRLDASRPKLVIADVRNRAELETAVAAAEAAPRVLLFPDDDIFGEAVHEFAELAPDDPALITFTSGTAGEPKAVVHGQRYLRGQRLQAEHWLAPRPRDLVWCTASSGWSKSARNAFIAPWLRGAAALLHDGPFDPHERLDIIARERVNVLCMAPTEYRLVAKRADLTEFPALHSLVAAGEALDPGALAAWRSATGLDIRDGYGQTETGQLTANPPNRPARPGSMGCALPGVRLWIDDGELVADPATIPTFFLGYGAPEPAPAVWRTGDRVRQAEDGYLYFEGRTDDVIISSGYRIGPFEVESALSDHAEVAEAAVVAQPDAERGSIVHAFVVLRDPGRASDAMARELKDFVKSRTAPYKYPRAVTFAESLPKTSTGKIKRGVLRDQVG